MLTRIFSVISIAAAVAVSPVMADQHGSHSKAMHKDHEGQAQQTCPVSGKPINKEVYVDHDGKRIYLCCASCKEKVMANPEKTISELEAKGVKLETVSHKQTHCPVMGGEIDKLLNSTYEGNKVYFCCPMCKPKFDKEPAKYIKQMKDKGIELEKVGKSE